MNDIMTENELARILLEGVSFQPGDIVECVKLSPGRNQPRFGETYIVRDAFRAPIKQIKTTDLSTDVYVICLEGVDGVFNTNCFVYHFPE